MSAYEIDLDGAFDIVFSIGVIHHLADPQAALRQMTKAAKLGGKVMIWVYGYENNEWIVRWFDPWRKLIFARLPIDVTHFLSLFPTILLWTLVRLGFGRIEVFRSAAQDLVPADAQHRVRPDAAADRELLAARRGRRPATRRGADRSRHGAGQRHVVDRHWHRPDISGKTG